VITVDNKPNSPAQYKDLQQAIDAANDGDIIYVSGSPVQYGDNNYTRINKRLTLYGAGYEPTKEFPDPSVVWGVSLSAASTGSKIIGFTLYYTDPYPPNAVADSIEIRRNSVGYLYLGGSNWTIENNLIGVIGRTVWGPPTQIRINNNIIKLYIAELNQPSVVITNNLFLYEGPAFIGVTNAIISNNIFYRAAPQGASRCSFNNNITYRTSNDTIPYGDNIGSGNLIGVNPLFVNFPDAGGNFKFEYDFHLKPGSPAIAAGTDGRDIGVYGGNSPIQVGGEPPLPQIKSMVIDNTVLPLNGTMHIRAKAKKQN